MELKINLDTNSIEKQLKDQAYAMFQELSIKNLSKHFENVTYYSPSQKKNVAVQGPGTLQINDTLEKFFDDPKTIERMNKFFDYNFERIMEETMTKALQHHNNRLVFSRTRNKASVANNPTESKES